MSNTNSETCLPRYGFKGFTDSHEYQLIVGHLHEDPGHQVQRCRYCGTLKVVQRATPDISH